MINLSVPSNIVDDSKSIYDSLTSLGYGSSQMQVIARPNSPIPGIAGFLFSIPKTAALSLRSTITDHYLGDNTAVQDHIALPPPRVTVSGEVAEMVIVSPPPQARIQSAPPPLPDTSMFALNGIPNFSVDTSLFPQPVTPTAYDIYSSQTGIGLSSQNLAVNYLVQLWRAPMIFSVETPWGLWTNMAIENVDATQNEQTQEVTAITVIFKQIRYASSVQVVSGTLMNQAGRAATQGGNGTSSASSIAKSAGNAIALTLSLVNTAASTAQTLVNSYIGGPII